MQVQTRDGTRTANTSCEHLWRRVRQLEEELSTVVYVRSCSKCGQVEANAGHKDPWSLEGWELVTATN
jgi:hypothetical protein